MTIVVIEYPRGQMSIHMARWRNDKDGEADMLSKRTILGLLVGTGVAGCGTPYGDHLQIDYGKNQIPGSITVSDAKLYRREALINERRREVSYIDKLMAKTEEAGFEITPDVVREIELIRSLAIDVGLSFDPAAGKINRDTNKTANIRNDINMLQLQLQLDQLKRDAALFREKLDAQTTPSRDDLGKPTTASAGAAAPGLSSADTKDLVSRIDGLQKTLADRLGTEVKGPRPANLTGNPIDQFRDRAAFRQVLTTARNAATLDELHDLNGAALYRLSFQITTLPPPAKYRRTAGIVQMQPFDLSGKMDQSEVQEIYIRWLDYVNQSLSGNGENSPLIVEINSLFASGEFLTGVKILYGKDNENNPCPGLVSMNKADKGCAKLAVAAPDLEASSVSNPSDNRTMGQVLSNDFGRLRSRLYDEGLALLENDDVAKKFLRPNACEILPASERRFFPEGSEAGKVNPLVSAAISASTAAPLITQALLRISTNTRADSLQGAAVTSALELIRDARARADTVLRRLGSPNCAEGQRLQAQQSLTVPMRFSETVTKAANVRVYDVGPREQVQQVSTAARAAEAFSLAAALAAKDPSSGGAVNAGLGYSRSAIGKVDVVERLPNIVGFAQAGSDVLQKNLEKDDTGAGRNAVQQVAPTVRKPAQFGWIFGPRVNTVDPKDGELELSQQQKTYDVSADLAVSGWRTKLQLAVSTAWAPDWNMQPVLSAINQPDNMRVVTVDLRPSAAEFAALTSQLASLEARGGQRFASVASMAPQKVKACAAATLVLQGDNLWRATDVIIGGRRLGTDAISVLPDMRGIALELPSDTSFPDITDQKAEIQILTPYGIAVSGSPLVVDGYKAEGCKEPATPPDGPVVASVSPEATNICSDPQFRLTGSDLDKLTLIRFGGASGTMAAATNKGKERLVSFTRKDLATIADDYETMQFFAGDKSRGGKAVRLVSKNCSSEKE